MKLKDKPSIQGKVLNEILENLSYINELLELPPYAGRRHSFEARMSWEVWRKMYSGEIKKRRALRDLRKKNWIEAQNTGNEVIVKISSDAIISALKEKIISTTKKLKDRTKCLLTYDFPIGSDNARQLWLRLILRLGLQQEQQSVYSTDLDIGTELKALSKMLGIERWVRVYTAKEA